jgi:hypothetical protein
LEVEGDIEVLDFCFPKRIAGFELEQLMKNEFKSKCSQKEEILENIVFNLTSEKEVAEILNQTEGVKSNPLQKAEKTELEAKQNPQLNS